MTVPGAVAVLKRRVRRLPMVLAPVDDEPLSSWVARMSHSYGVPTSDMLYALGLTDRTNGLTGLIGYGTLLDPERALMLAEATGLSEERISAMLLPSVGGRVADLSALDQRDPRSFVAVARRVWLLFRDSRACGACLADRSGAWRLQWKLPWSFACLHHSRLLTETCPRCGNNHGLATRESCAPVLPGRVPEPLLCNQPQARAGRGQSRARGENPRSVKRESCGHPLGSVLGTDLSGTRVLSAQAEIDRVIVTGEGRMAGDLVPATQYFAELRSLYSLVMHHGRVEDLGTTLPRELRDAAAAFFADRDATRSGNSTSAVTAPHGQSRSNPNKKHVVMYRRTLTDVAVTAALAPTVCGMAASADIAELSDALADFAGRIYERHGGRLGLQSYYGLSPRLEAAALAAMPRRRSSMWVKSEVVRLGDDATDPLQYGRWVPSLLWHDVWQRYFAPHIATRADKPARRFLSMQVVKLATQCSWAAAAAATGNGTLQPGVAVGYVNRATREGTAEALRTATETVISLIDARVAAGTAVDYSQRRDALADFQRIAPDMWGGVLAAGQINDTTKQRYSSATWLWSELTGCHPNEAPALATGPKRATEMYQQFTAREMQQPATRAALIDCGRRMLTALGDAHPEQVELTMLDTTALV